ncbi:MAG: hypothetical protein ACK5PC_06195 [Cyclobacteriaceae bacterium]
MRGISSNVRTRTIASVLSGLTANNGVNRTGNNFRLGGSLTGNTILNLNGFYLNQSSGALLLGNSISDTPTPNTRLDVRGVGSGDILRVADSTNTTRFDVAENGQAVFGNVSPTANIAVEINNPTSVAGARSLLVRNTTNNINSASNIQFGNDTANGFDLTYNSTLNTSGGGGGSFNIGSPSAVPIALQISGQNGYILGAGRLHTFNSGNNSFNNTSFQFTQGNNSNNIPQGLLFIGGAHTNLTTTVESTDVNFNLARTVQWASGNISTQRAVRIQAPTYGFVGASTITDAVTLDISGNPVAGTNATITNRWALRAGGNVQITGNRINFSGLPTSSAGLATGDLWNDAGTLKIV